MCVCVCDIIDRKIPFYAYAVMEKHGESELTINCQRFLKQSDSRETLRSLAPAITPAGKRSFSFREEGKKKEGRRERKEKIGKEFLKNIPPPLSFARFIKFWKIENENDENFLNGGRGWRGKNDGRKKVPLNESYPPPLFCIFF